MAEERVIKTLDSDLEKMVNSGWLSRDCFYSLRITGPWTPEHIQRLIDILALHKNWLAQKVETK